MRVRYFPQTHVPASVADVLKRLFDDVAVIVASDDDPVPEGLTAMGPSPEEAERLRALLAGWRQFSGLHREGASTYALGLESRGDGLDDQLTSQIKSELMRQVEGVPERDKGADSLTAARALLSLAVEHDLRSRDLNRELARLERMQADLFDALKGEVPELPEPDGVSGHPGEVKMLQRLSAWATLFVAEGEPLPDRVFVTTSREALELVAEYSAPMEELGVMEAGSLPGEFLDKLFAGAPLPEGAVGGDEPVMVRIFITRCEHPYNVFNEFIRGADVCCVDCVRQGIDIKPDILFILLEGLAAD